MLRCFCGLLLLALVGVLLPEAATAADVPSLIRASKPSVVLVGTFSETDSPRFQFRGTGFAVGHGLQIVTSAHVLPASGELAESGRRLGVLVQRSGQWDFTAAEVSRTDANHDLAVLKIQGAPIPPLSLADGDVLGEGTEVLLLGFPLGNVLGFSVVTHRGMISAVVQSVPPAAASQQLTARTILALRSGSFDILQLDAVAYPGNSGGPLLETASGRVAGVLMGGVIKGAREAALSAPSGISYAVPVKYLEPLLTP